MSWGIAPKDLQIRDGGGLIPPELGADPEKTLLITCLAGGGVFGREFGRIGVAAKMVRRAMQEAKERGFLWVDAKPHDPGIDRVYRRCGFERVAWEEGSKSPFPEAAFYRADLRK